MTTLETDIKDALDRLAERISVEPRQAASHQVLLVKGIDGSPECLRALAIYCVGQIAKAVQVNLELRADLLGVGLQAQRQLASDVYSIIGATNSALSNGQKETERDPWLFEALSHLLIHLSRHKRDLLPAGKLVGLSMTHSHAKDHGLDLVAIYEGPLVGLGLGECKAWEKRPSDALRDASGKFADIEAGNYEAELRAVVGLMRKHLPSGLQTQIIGAFWHDERSYLPFIGYDSRISRDWGRKRKVLDRLAVPTSHRILFPVPINQFRIFFDKLSDAMRAYVKTVEL